MEKQPFDARATALAKQAMEQLLTEVPELQSVAIVFDWGERNDRELGSVFMDQNRNIGRLSMHSGLHLVSQTGRLQQLLFTAFDKHLTILREEHATLTQARLAAAATSPADHAPGGPAAAPENPT